MIRPITFLHEIETDVLDFAEKEPLVKVLAQFGSRLNGNFDLLSDLDYFIVTDKIPIVQENLESLKPHLFLHYQNRSVLYFKSELWNYDIRKIDIVLSHKFEDVSKYIKTIDDLSKVIVLDKIGISEKLVDIESKKDQSQIVIYHVNRFVEAFENCSVANQSSDRYRFLFHQTIVLQHLFVLEYMSNGHQDFNYLPKQFTNSLPQDISDILTKNFDPDSDLSQGRITREEMLKKFEIVLDRINISYPHLVQSDAVLKFLNQILKRDWIWNLRDFADINPRMLKSNMLIRSSSLSHYQNDPFYEDYFKELKINSIIDLRFDEEIKQSKYDSENINYVNIPIGSKHITPHGLRYTKIGEDPFFYEYFPRHYHEEIAKIFRSILTLRKPVVLHCYAGKDRTGIIVALLQKLIGLSEKEIVMDYISSRSNTNQKKIKVTLTLVEEFGGILQYLQNIGLSENEIEKLKNQFSGTLRE